MRTTLVAPTERDRSATTTAQPLPRKRAARSLVSVMKHVLLLIGAVVFALELPGRVAYHLGRSPQPQLLVGAYPDTLRQQLEHDYLSPETRIRYEFDMFLGWHAVPLQRGLTYEIDAAGRRQPRSAAASSARSVVLTGGSGAWSLGASGNEHTIAAYLARDIDQRPGAAGPLRVLNLAEQAYGLRQESIEVFDLVGTEHPELVIFYDGVNDLHTIWSGKDPRHYRTFTAYPQILKEALQQTTGSPFVFTSSDLLELSMTYRAVQLASAILKSSAESEQQRVVLSPAQVAEIKTFFREQIVRNHRLLRGLGIRSLFVLQPIAYVDKPIHEREQFVLHDRYREWWQAAYAVLEQEYEAIGDEEGIATVSLAHVFRDEQRQTYLDPTHLNDLGNEIVAGSLTAKVLEMLGTTGAEPLHAANNELRRR